MKQLILIGLMILTSCVSDVVGVIENKYTRNDLPNAHFESYLDCGWDFINESFECKPATRTTFTYDRFGYLFDIQTEDKLITIEVSENTYNKYEIGDKYNSKKERK